MIYIVGYYRKDEKGKKEYAELLINAESPKEIREKINANVPGFNTVVFTPPNLSILEAIEILKKDSIHD